MIVGVGIFPVFLFFVPQLIVVIGTGAARQRVVEQKQHGAGFHQLIFALGPYRLDQRQGALLKPTLTLELVPGGCSPLASHLFHCPLALGELRPAMRASGRYSGMNSSMLMSAAAGPSSGR